MICEVSRWKNKGKIRVLFFLRWNVFIFFSYNDFIMTMSWWDYCFCAPMKCGQNIFRLILKRKKIHFWKNRNVEKNHFWDNRKSRFWAVTHRLAAIKSADSATLGVSCSSCVLSDSYGRREAGERAGGPDLTCKMLWNDVKTDPGEMNIFYRTFSCSYDRSELKIV